jgi:hypothetical protein
MQDDRTIRGITVLNEEAKAQVAKEMIAWQIHQAMKKKGLTKKRMAKLMEMSRTQVDS